MGRVWTEYSKVLNDVGVAADKRAWYQRWCERFRRYLKGRHFQEAQARDVQDYLGGIADSANMSQWQVEQAHEALELLLGKTLGVAWVQEGMVPVPQHRDVEGEEDNRWRDRARCTVKSGGDEGTLPKRYEKVVEEARVLLRRNGYALRTERTYLDWVRRFFIYHQPGSREELDDGAIEGYLNYLAIARRVNSNTQRQALNALVFFYRNILKREVGEGLMIKPGSTRRKLPVVLTREECRELLDEISGEYALVARLLYGSGLRIMECLRLRVQDVDIERRMIRIQLGKGGKSRVAPLPESLIVDCRNQIEEVRKRFEEDREKETAGVYLPESVRNKAPGKCQNIRVAVFFPREKIISGPEDGIGSAPSPP
jgi:integrase